MPLFKPNVEKLRAKRDVAHLIEALTCGDPTVSLAAAGALGEVGDARAVRPLLAALGSGNPELRARAVEALGRLGNSPFFTFSPAQFAELENDPDRAGELKMLLGVGYAIRVLEPDEVEALARELRESGVVTRLIALLAAEDERLGGVVAAALGEFGEDALDSSIAALEGENHFARPPAAMALGLIGDRRAVALPSK